MSFVQALRLARLTASRSAIDALVHTLTNILSQPGGRENLLQKLPLAILPEIRWLMKEAASEQLHAALQPILTEKNDE